MRMRALFAVPIISAFYLAACESSSEGLAAPGSKEDMLSNLTGKQWMRSALTISPGYDIYNDGQVVSDLYAAGDACRHDDILTFTADGAWKGDEGPTKCHVSDPQTSTGEWSFSAERDSMIITQPSGSFTAKIRTLNATTLSLAGISDYWGDGQTRVETATFRAK
jgi:hypothetical protein